MRDDRLAPPPGTARRWAGLPAILAFPLPAPIVTTFHPIRVAAEESPGRLFAAHALALRTAGVAGEGAAAEAGPVESLAGATAARLEAFRSAHP